MLEIFFTVPEGFRYIVKVRNNADNSIMGKEYRLRVVLVWIISNKNIVLHQVIFWPYGCQSAVLPLLQIPA
jgi:hypothetical protein